MQQTFEQLNSRLEANRVEIVSNADGIKSDSSQTDCESRAPIEELMRHAGLEPSLENASTIYALTDAPDYLLQGLNFEGRPVYRFVKRTFDVVASAVGMCLLSWLILGTAIAVKATSPGPVIFKQQRVGKNKQLFNIYKFRTMRIDTPNLPSHMIDANDWLTPIGAIMRRFSLDELPQLWNIFKCMQCAASCSRDVQHLVIRNVLHLALLNALKRISCKVPHNCKYPPRKCYRMEHGTNCYDSHLTYCAACLFFRWAS